MVLRVGKMVLRVGLGKAGLHVPGNATARVYTGDNRLLPGPNWAGLELLNGAGRSTERRLLDLRTGALVRSGNVASGLRSMRFVSVAATSIRAVVRGWFDSRNGRLLACDRLPTDARRSCVTLSVRPANGPSALPRMGPRS